MPDTMIERVARALWDEQREAMTGTEPDGWLKGMPWDSIARDDVTKGVAAQMRSAARAAIAAHSPQEAAAARDAALVERGRREGIEEAALVAEQTDEEGVFPEWCDGPEIADAIRALATPPADGGPR